MPKHDGRAVRLGRRRVVAAVVFAATCGFLAGMAVMAMLTLIYRGPSDPPRVDAAVQSPGVKDARTTVSAAVAAADDAVPAGRDARAIGDADVDVDVAELRRRRLVVPIAALAADQLRRSFDEARGNGRRHEAIDLLAARHTPVLAVDDGLVARMLTSRAGGISVYQFDPTTRYVYYYAHLQGYAEGLTEGAMVRRGQVLGYVGTSGNAPADTPHLHFAIAVLDEGEPWWQGTPIDPYDVLR
ncbi:MAG: M23 family metallopeptidase [Vicinamibacterales bacterium]